MKQNEFNYRRSLRQNFQQYRRTIKTIVAARKIAKIIIPVLPKYWEIYWSNALFELCIRHKINYGYTTEIEFWNVMDHIAKIIDSPLLGYKIGDSKYLAAKTFYKDPELSEGIPIVAIVEVKRDKVTSVNEIGRNDDD